MNKTVVITGANGVLCSSFAKALAKEGYSLALIDIKHSSLADEICKNGGIAKEYLASVLDKSQLEYVKNEILKDFKSVDALINGAGGNHPDATTQNEVFQDGDLEKDITTFFDLSEDGFNKVFDLNIKGTLLPTQVFAKEMLPNKNGVILNLSSMNAFSPLTKIPAYSAAKAGVTNLTQWLAVHFAKQNIRVNALAPGFFATNQNKALLFEENGSLTKRSEKILSQTPMQRFGDPSDLIGTLLFLIDNQKSGFITGITIPVDGGFSAYSGV